MDTVTWKSSTCFDVTGSKSSHVPGPGSSFSIVYSGYSVTLSGVYTDDFLYKTHSATTESLAAAEKRLHTKVPKAKTISQELHEESPGIFVREIIVKPVPFVTVGVRQEFELRCDEAEECELSRAEYIKLSGGKD